MINWIIAFYYFLNTFGFLNLEQMLIQNLPLLLICRGIYIITYYFNYEKDYLKELRGDEQLFTKKEVYYFSFKQLLLILYGILFTPIAVFIAFYSLLIGGHYLKSVGNKINRKILKIIGIITYFFSPLIGIFYFTFISPNYYSIAAVGIGLLAFLYYGLKNSKLSLQTLIDKYTKRKINKIPKLASYILFIIILAFPTTLIIGTAVYNPQPKYTFKVPMRDDVELATDVYFAPGSFGAPRPVILIRTPYGKSGWANDLYLPIYSIQDYHVVIQDLRGTGDSEGGGSYLLFVNSYLDGVDTINWILNQNWCNGKIASAGVSALCINEYFYAGMGPDGLVAQQLWFGTPELFDHAIFQGSYHKSSVETWISSTSPTNAQYQIDTLFTTIPKNEVLYNSTSLSIPLGPHYSNISVYGIHVGGWYDHFLQGTLDGYIGYDDYGNSRAKGHQKLIMGPWTHGSVYGGKQGELTYPENSNGFNLLLDWETKVFDDALLGIPTDWDNARVAYYLMGDVDSPSNQWNYWRYAYDWPLDHVDDEWFFNADGSLSKISPGVINKNFSYLFDPRFPVPNLGGQNQPFDLAGPMDQSSIETRSDVIIFETPALTDAVEIVGRIWGHLYIASNCSDTDFTIKLTDVYPNGRSMLITDGSLTVRFRDNYSTELLMSGNVNDVYEILIDCWSTAYTFAPGHKIRIAISSSNYPRFATNPNTGAPLAREYLTSYIANNTLLTGPKYNSSIILPRLVNISSTHIIY
ncbi:MAG: CocE/NonD family hydrolase [Candidatus Lokiarchaeota archaeon]|nr:CocE/NonD family hydrolase [Candidatus Lokiarchaeota archaeon]